MKAWIVISPVKPPADWGFKPDPWGKPRYFRVLTSERHATEIHRDLFRLEINPDKLKVKAFNAKQIKT